MPVTRTAARAAPSPRRPTLTNGTLGAAIRRARHDQHLLLDKLAERTGINIKVLSRIELGERPCRVAEMVCIAEALQTAPDTLLETAAEIRTNMLADIAAGRI